MRSLNIKELKDIFKEFDQEINTYFVETGTYKGLTIFPMSKYFKKLYTIEINKNAYEFCKKRAKNVNNIEFILGDSAIEMNKLVKKFNFNDSVVFFLDGHVTNNNSGFTGKGIKDVPIMEELDAIYKDFKGNGIIIIDDTRLFNKSTSKETADADWSDINLPNILNHFKEDRILKYLFVKGGGLKKEENDRLIIKFKSLSN
jgi:hypothetical protein